MVRHHVNAGDSSPLSFVNFSSPSMLHLGALGHWHWGTFSFFIIIGYFTTSLPNTHMSFTITTRAQNIIGPHHHLGYHVFFFPSLQLDT
jgi:hypothetical protein